ncbi:MAG: TIGR03067 domain-containing protein [Gemmataceae bacterium]|nr:TIGR03067 domain-containing protein [Gemmataceae bacterium]MDW8242322.1 TIGR03067 domain-containing protein [Thermogemmata sp.]
MLRVGLAGGILGLAAAISISMGSLSAGEPGGAGDLAALQGRWTLLHCEYEGRPQMTPEVMKQITAVFDQNDYTLYFADKGKDGQARAIVLATVQVTLDPTTQPKGITFEFKEGPLKGQKRHGIYELAGNQLKLCYGPAERPRPQEFRAPPGSGYFLETWARHIR